MPTAFGIAARAALLAACAALLSASPPAAAQQPVPAAPAAGALSESPRPTSAKPAAAKPAAAKAASPAKAAPQAGSSRSAKSAKPPKGAKPTAKAPAKSGGAKTAAGAKGGAKAAAAKGAGAKKGAKAGGASAKGDGFAAFCALWMTKLAERERANLERVSAQAKGGGELEYVGYSAEPSRCESRVKKAGKAGAGVLVYTELHYRLREAPGAGSSAAAAIPEVVRSSEVTEVFRYDGRRWIY